ncbi:MAG TPA: XdhC family protein [Conexivisphaerales archaeon]|nr:XdhC family protein [Conexivisphaerales archaeon]
MEDIYTIASRMLADGMRLVIATVVEADGSVPRGVSTKMIIPEAGPTVGTIGGGCVEKYVVREARFVFEDGQTRIKDFNLGDESWSGLGMACGGTVKVALELVEPSERLIIFGSGNISRACYKLAEMLGYRVMVLDPFASVEAFPNAEVYTQDVLQKIREVKINAYDNILVITEHRYDAEALRTVLDTKARYVGMIGSKNRVNSAYRELLKEGIPADRLFQIYAPVGIDIGAETPEEIAISIMAEVIKVRRGGTSQHLRLTKLLDKPEPTHPLKHKESTEVVTEAPDVAAGIQKPKDG